MLFEISLSPTALSNIFTARLAQAQQLCQPLPTNPTSAGVLFDRIDMKGTPEFSVVYSPHNVTLPNLTVLQLSGHRVRIIQKFDIWGATVGSEVVHLSLGEGSLWLAMYVEVTNGNASICIHFEDLHLPDTVPPLQAWSAKSAIQSSISKICTPVPIGDLLNELTGELPFQVPLFTSTDVLNAGLAPAPGESLAILIRIEVDTISSYAAQEWTNFHKGTDSPKISDLATQAGIPASTIDWTLTVDRQLFSRIVSGIASQVETDSHHASTPGHLDLAKPSTKWHVSEDLWGSDPTTFPPILKKLASNLPTMTASIEGTAVDACPGLLGRVDIDFTLDLTLAFAVPQPDTLRLYTKVHIDASDFDLFKCGVNIAATFVGPMVGAFGVFGVAVAAFLAVVVVSIAADSVGNFPTAKKCWQEDGMQVCDVPWHSASSLGNLHLAAVAGAARGLVLMGPLVPPQQVPVPPLSWKLSWPFKWVPVNCAKIESKDELRTEARGYVFGARLCDVRVLDDQDGAYLPIISPGGMGLRVLCIKVLSQAPAYPCRLLLATTRGLLLVSIPPPPADVSLAAVEATQSILCMEFPTPIRRFHRFPDELDVIPVELDLVVVDIAIAGQEPSRIAQLYADDRLIAAGRPGLLGLTALTAALEPGQVNTELSVRLAGSRRATTATRSVMAASLELWRSAGTVATLGVIRDVSRPEDGAFWVATSYGLLRFEIRNGSSILANHIPTSGVRALCTVESGMLVAGDNGLELIDAGTGQRQALFDTGPVDVLARYGSVLYASGSGTTRALRLATTAGPRGRDGSTTLDVIGTYETGAVRSAARVGQFLVLASGDKLNVHRIRPDGGLTSVRSLGLAGERGVHRAVGNGSHEAIVAATGDRATLIRVDSLAKSRRQRPAALDLPTVPWFVGAHRTNEVLVRVRPDESVIDVYTPMVTVDLLRREADRQGQTRSAGRASNCQYLWIGR